MEINFFAKSYPVFHSNGIFIYLFCVKNIFCFFLCLFQICTYLMDANYSNRGDKLSPTTIEVRFKEYSKPTKYVLETINSTENWKFQGWPSRRNDSEEIT